MYKASSYFKLHTKMSNCRFSKMRHRNYKVLKIVSIKLPARKGKIWDQYFWLFVSREIENYVLRTHDNFSSDHGN